MKNHYQPIIHHNLGLSLLALKNPHSSGRWGEKEQLGHSFQSRPRGPARYFSVRNTGSHPISGRIEGPWYGYGIYGVGLFHFNLAKLKLGCHWCMSHIQFYTYTTLYYYTYILYRVFICIYIILFNGIYVCVHTWKKSCTS